MKKIVLRQNTSGYAEEKIYFDSHAAGIGNGTKDMPYTDFNDAFTACKNLLKSLTVPTHVTLYVKGGAHPVKEIAELDFDEVPFEECTFTIRGDESAEKRPALTTAREIPTSAFEAVEGKEGLYVYSFAPDSEGNYPQFRNLYVNGAMADLAHSTPTTTANGEFPYLSRFDRDYAGTFLKAQFYYNEGTLAAHTPEVEYATLPERTDLLEGYTLHYTKFLALADLKEKYAANPDALEALTVEAVRPGSDEVYKEAFAEFHAKLLEAKANGTSPDAVIYKYALPTTPETRPGVIYLHPDMVEPLRKTVEGKIAAMKAEGKYDATSSFKTILLDLQAELHATAEWHYNIIHVAGIDFDDVVYFKIPKGPDAGKVETAVAVYLDQEQYQRYAIPGGNNMSNRYVFLQNALEFVDADDEYYYDLATGKLYYFSKNGLEGKTFAYPSLDNLLVFRNARNVTVRGLDIWGVDDYTLSEIGLAAFQAGNNNTGSEELGHRGFIRRSALAFFNAYGVSIRDCYIHDIGGAGIDMEGRAENIDVSSNKIENIGDSAIRLCGCREAFGEFSERSGAENVKIINNYVHRVTRSVYNAVAIYLAACKDVELAYNTVIGCAYSAFSLGWKWDKATWEEGENYNVYNADIHHNYITHFMQDLADGSAFYMVGGNLKPENPKLVNFIHDNFVVLSQYTGSGLGVHTSCYYFDGSSTNWDFYDNIAVNYSAGADRGALPEANHKDFTMYVRRTQRNYIFFMQWVAQSAYSYNIYSRNNRAFNVRATDPEAQQRECFSLDGGSHVPHKERGVIVTDTVYHSGEDKLHFTDVEKAMIEATGCSMRRGEWEWLVDNEY